MMAHGPIFHADWYEKDSKQTHQVPVVQINNEFTKVLILFKKGLHEVAVEDVRWARWD